MGDRDSLDKTLTWFQKTFTNAWSTGKDAEETADLFEGFFKKYYGSYSSWIDTEGTKKGVVTFDENKDKTGTILKFKHDMPIIIDANKQKYNNIIVSHAYNNITFFDNDVAVYSYDRPSKEEENEILAGIMEDRSLVFHKNKFIRCMKG